MMETSRAADWRDQVWAAARAPERACFGLKYPLLTPQARLENLNRDSFLFIPCLFENKIKCLLLGALVIYEARRTTRGPWPERGIAVDRWTWCQSAFLCKKADIPHTQPAAHRFWQTPLTG